MINIKQDRYNKEEIKELKFSKKEKKKFEFKFFGKSFTLKLWF